ncbi:MAG: DNA-binding protein, partial [Syntrophomonadaceae bacterium]|nr:DNA-binding protein [Syntrophomonadaceae bacterium]
LCSSGRILGAVRKGRIWLIPKNTQKPIDGRTKTAKQSEIEN